jgi:hypothetical protein
LLLIPVRLPHDLRRSACPLFIDTTHVSSLIKQGADSDKELFERVPEHVDADHPEMEISDEKVHHIVERGAYEK